jgi:protein SCO1/2
MKERTLAIRVFQVLSGLILGMAAVALLLTGLGPDEPLADQDEHFLADPLPAPDFRLLSQTGEEVGPSDFPGKVLLVFFGYTSCPDVCPLTLTHLTRALDELGEDARRVQVLLITVDPARDTPERLRTYLSGFNESFLGLTGTEAEIREVASAFGAFFVRNGEGEGYTVDHTARTFVLDPSGSIPLTFPITAGPQEIARDLGELMRRLPAYPEGDR